MNYIKSVFTGKKPSFYVACVAAIMALVAALCYSIYFYDSEKAYLAKYVSWMPTAFSAIGVVAFVGLTFLKQSQIGAAIIAASSFASFVSYVSTIYGWPVEQIMVFPIDKIPEFPMIVICAVLMLLSAILANITAWKKHNKEEK